MREAAVILLVILALFGLTLYRYRKQVGFAVQIWRAMRAIRKKQGEVAASHSPHIEPAVENGSLVRCSKCGTWVAESRGIRFGPTIYYCSTACLQKNAKV